MWGNDFWRNITGYPQPHQHSVVNQPRHSLSDRSCSPLRSRLADSRRQPEPVILMESGPVKYQLTSDDKSFDARGIILFKYLTIGQCHYSRGHTGMFVQQHPDSWVRANRDGWPIQLGLRWPVYWRSLTSNRQPSRENGWCANPSGFSSQLPAGQSPCSSENTPSSTRISSPSTCS